MEWSAGATGWKVRGFGGKAKHGLARFSLLSIVICQQAGGFISTPGPRKLQGPHDAGRWRRLGAHKEEAGSSQGLQPPGAGRGGGRGLAAVWPAGSKNLMATRPRAAPTVRLGRSRHLTHQLAALPRLRARVPLQLSHWLFQRPSPRRLQQDRPSDWPLSFDVSF